MSGFAALSPTYALSNAPDDPEVARAFQKRSLSAAEVNVVLERIRRSGVLDQVRALANEYASRARQSLDALPASADKDQLVLLIEQLVSRRN